MALTAWSLQTGGIAVALISLVLIATLGWVLIEPRRRAIDRLAREAPDGPLPQSLERRTHDPILATALQTVAALLLGIVFLMTTKPALTSSLIVMEVALALGLASGVLVSRATGYQGYECDKSLANSKMGKVWIGDRLTGLSGVLPGKRHPDLSLCL